MARRYPKIPHVTLSDKGAGKAINITFLDPREPDPKNPLKPKPKCKSTKTTDAKVAERIAWQVSDIITNNQFDDPPPGTLSQTLRILQIREHEQEVEDAILDDFWNTTRGKRDSPPTLREILGHLQFENPPERDSDSDPEDDNLELIIEIEKLLKQIKTLKQRLHNLNTELLEERKRTEALDAQLIATGQQKAKYGKITLGQAIENFLSTDPNKGGCGAKKKRWKDTVTQYLKAFEKSIGANVKLSDIEPERITSYLAKKLKTAKPKSVKQVENQITKLLRHQSRGTLIGTIGEVNEWIRTNCTSPGKNNFYWPSSEDVSKLLNEIRDGSTQYWHDAAIIQYGCGFRPEELPFLQEKYVIQTTQEFSIRVDDLLDGKGDSYWSPKNLQSIEKVSVPKVAQAAVLRRLNSGSIVLFPRIHAECGGNKPRNLTRDDSFMKKHSLWKPGLFCQHYIKILREAGKAAGLDASKMDSRTLRRVCGKEILLKTGSYEKAAAVLRNDPETCRRWYAQFKAPDVSTERETAIGKELSQ